MYFQAIDDKQECIGIYKDGVLYFDDMPKELHRTWKYSGSIKDEDIEYAWLYCNGSSLRFACPPDLLEDYNKIQQKQAFINLSCLHIGEIFSCETLVTHRYY